MNWSAFVSILGMATGVGLATIGFVLGLNWVADKYGDHIGALALLAAMILAVAIVFGLMVPQP